MHATSRQVGCNLTMPCEVFSQDPLLLGGLTVEVHTFGLPAGTDDRGYSFREFLAESCRISGDLVKIVETR